jgi:hypothetical protein
MNVLHDPTHTVSCMDSWARAQGIATYSEMRGALRDLLDMWHGGHLQVRPEALGAWHAAVQIGEDAIAKGTDGVDSHGEVTRGVPGGEVKHG